MDTRNGSYMNTIEPSGRVETLRSTFLLLFRALILGMVASFPGSAQVSVICSTVLEPTKCWVGPGNEPKK